MKRELNSRRYGKLRALLTDARKEREMTQAQVAKALKRQQSFVAKYERGERRLDVMEFIDVCKAVGLSASDVIAELE